MSLKHYADDRTTKSVKFLAELCKYFADMMKHFLKRAFHNFKCIVFKAVFFFKAAYTAFWLNN